MKEKDVYGWIKDIKKMDAAVDSKEQIGIVGEMMADKNRGQEGPPNADHGKKKVLFFSPAAKQGQTCQCQVDDQTQDRWNDKHPAFC